MSNFIKDMKNLTEKGTPSSGYTFIFMQVHNLVKNNDATFAYGQNVLTKEFVYVRLNTISEASEDYAKEKKVSLKIATDKIKSQYTGRHARQSLEQKESSYRPTFLAFEKCLEIKSISDNNKTYRSHWSKIISSKNDVEFISGIASISCFDDRKGLSQKIKASATIVEYVRDLEINNTELNLQMVHHALRNKDKDLLREGCLTFCLTKDSEEISEVTIKQSYELKNDGNIEYTLPLSSEDSLKAFLEPYDNTGSTEWGIVKDVGRIILYLFCGIPLNKNEFSSQDDTYLTELRNLLTAIKNNEIKVKIVGMRVLRFGKERIETLLPRGSFDPIAIYKKQDHNNPEPPIQNFIPTIFALQKTPHGRRYIVFNERMYFNKKDNPTLSIYELPISTEKPKITSYIQQNTQP